MTGSVANSVATAILGESGTRIAFCLSIRYAGLAQWQCSGFVNRRSGVRIPHPAPRSHGMNCDLTVFTIRRRPGILLGHLGMAEGGDTPLPHKCRRPVLLSLNSADRRDRP